MKTFYKPFATATPENGQTIALHASNGQAIPGNCNDKTSSEKMKNRNVILTILAFMLWLGNVYAQDFVMQIPEPPILSPTAVVGRTVQGYGNDSIYYMLRSGIKSYVNGYQHPSHDIGITSITKFTKAGGVIWQKFYGLTPSITADSSELLGYGIAVDSGTAATGDIAIGGYATFNITSTGSHTDNDFVMVLDTSGAIVWAQYWNPNGSSNLSNGVTDLLFNHESAHSGSITAVSVDTNTTSHVANLYVTLINSSGIIAMEQLTDSWDYYFNKGGNPISGTPNGSHPKPRIAESPSDTTYYVVGSRGTSTPSNDIGFWKVRYGLSSTPHFFEVNSGSGGPDFYVTGIAEDEGAYSPSGTPTVYLSGFYNSSAPNPLWIEVTSLTSSVPTFTPLEETSVSSNYLYLTDIAIMREKSGSVYQLMSTANYFGGLTPTTNNMYIFTVPMNFSSAPAGTYNILTTGILNPIAGEFGGLTSTHDPQTYMMSSNFFYGEYLFTRVDANLDLCNPALPINTSEPSYSVSHNTVGSSVSVSASSTTPYDSSLHPGVAPICQGDAPTASRPKEFGIVPAQANGIGVAIAISIYPNPVTEQAWVDFSSQASTTATIVVYDMTGRQVVCQNTGVSIGANHIAVDMHSIIPGLYMMKITNADGSICTSAPIEKY